MPNDRTFICEKCDFQTEDHAVYKQHKIDHQLGKEVSVAVVADNEDLKPEDLVSQPGKLIAPVVTPDPDRKPIELKYVYEGNCTECGKHVTTLEIDVANKHFVIAYCSAHNKQIESREVVKL